MSQLTASSAAHPTRRRLFLGAAAGVLALTLTACGDDATPSSTESPSAAAGFPVTIEGAEGTAVIPAAPKRVVSVGFQRDIDEAVSLGVTPVAVTPASNFPSGLPPWVEAKLDGAAPKQLPVGDSLPYEQIAAEKPDLILGTDSYSLADDFANLSAIAPTLSYQKDVAQDTWQTRATRIGQALGRSAEARAAVADVEKRITTAKEQNAAAFAGKTFSFSLLNAEGQIATIKLPTDASAQFFSQLGLTLSEQVTTLPDAGPQGRAVVSPENTKVLDADIVIFSYRTPEERTKVESDRLFKALPAVQRGSYVPLEVGSALALAFPSTLSIPYALDQIVPDLARAAEKVR
jgi:iron complex transport system substrate-binding protein